jgi:hypothetical protein
MKHGIDDNLAGASSSASPEISFICHVRDDGLDVSSSKLLLRLLLKTNVSFEKRFCPTDHETDRRGEAIILCVSSSNDQKLLSNLQTRVLS